MGRPLRLIEPDVLYFITDRTTQSRMLLRPSAKSNNEIGASLARASQVHGVKIYAYVVTSNHVHLIVSGNHETIPAFMRDFKSWSAKKVGRLVDWSGAFWQRRYSCEPILDDEALRRRYAYIAQHGVKEGLVDRPEDWPGLHCVTQLRTGRTRTFQWFDASGFFRASKAGENPSRAQFTQPVVLELSIPPFLAGTDEAKVWAQMTELVEQATRDAVEQREGAPSLGAEKVLDQDPYSRPHASKRSPRPLCHASTRDGWRGYKAKYLAFASAFRAAVSSWRSRKAVAFPAYAYSPGRLAFALS